MDLFDPSPSPAEKPKKETSPGRRLRSIEEASRNGQPPRLPTSKPAPRLRIPRPDREKVRRAYWNVTGTLSLIINVILIAVLIILSRMIFQMGQMVNQKVLFEGLYINFGKMDEAHIKGIIPVNDEISITLPINQTTVVTLTEDTLIKGAHVGILSTPTDIILPAGTLLPIQLNMTVQATVPIALAVSVDIPLSQTELHEPFSDLQKTFEPFISLLYQKADWEQLGFCKTFHGLCAWWFYP